RRAREAEETVQDHPLLRRRLRGQGPPHGDLLRRAGGVLAAGGACDAGHCTAVGSVIWNVAPAPSRLLARERLPPWASTIDRAMARPMPIPVGLVVKKGLN